ncbi:MAG: TRAP transporter substrate-binding protein [Spirochaetes bacterium]|nr:TRAP transporter substrate-binding protein [Spirochaetota bacterium]
MLKKGLVIALSLFVLAFTVYGGGKKEEVQKLTLKLGHGAAPNNPRHVVAVQFADYVKQQSNGNITVEVFPSEQLGSDRQMAEAVSMGALDLSINSQGPVAYYNEKLLVLGLPFLFAKPEQAYAVLDGEVGEQISNELVKKGIRVLAYWENGFRHITNSKRPIYKPDDLKGLKIRTPEDKITIAIFKALGANPAPLAFGELYMALSQGLFDGQENPVTNIYYSKLYEVQKYLSLSNHKYETCPMIISEKLWQKLTPANQKLLKEAAMKYAQEHRKLNIKTNNDLIEEVKKAGVQVNQADVAALREATKSVNKEFEPTFGKELIDKVISVAASVK